ncbi:MAG: metallophosphoesterase [Pseudomonadales bacterium]
MTRILQITDCHLLEAEGALLLGVDTAASLGAVLDQALAQQNPDLLLVSGDVGHDGKAATYDRFARIVRERFAGRMLALPGNHDAGQTLARTLEAQGAETAVGAVKSLELDGWQLIALDSHIDDEPQAALSPVHVEELRALVEAATLPLLITLHHPLLPVGAPWLDKDCLREGRALLEWLAARPLVRAVVFGHVHQSVDEAFKNLRLWGTPSTCFQFAPGSQSFSVDHRQPGYRWLTLEHSGSIHSQVERLSDFPLTIKQ